MPRCFRGTRDTDRVWQQYTQTKLGSVATHIVVTTHIDISTCIFHKSSVYPFSFQLSGSGSAVRERYGAFLLSTWEKIISGN